MDLDRASTVLPCFSAELCRSEYLTFQVIREVYLSKYKYNLISQFNLINDVT